MKNQLITIILITLSISLFGQNALSNMQKYVYYKQRFLNNFIAVGNGMGESLPLDIRRMSKSNIVNGPSVHEFGIGDATLRLGWYIAVLATEYKLLNVQGLDTYQTTKELYYALEAFNRLDLNAESYFNLGNPYNNPNPNQAISPPSSDLNGFFIRDDMTDNFIDSTYYVDEYNKLPDTQYYINFTSTNTTSHPHLKTSPQSNIYMSGVRGEFNQYRNSPTINDANPYKDEMSKDHIFDLFLGLALVKKCVDSGANFNNLPMADNEISIQQEAINITNRIIDRIVADEFILKNQSDLYEGECTVSPNECGDDLSSNSCQNNCSLGDASNLRPFGYAVVNAASYITGRSVSDIYGNQAWRMPGQMAVWNLLGSAQAISVLETIALLGGDDAKHEYKFMTALAAVGGQWLNTNFAVLFDIQSFLYNLFLDPLTASDFDGYALTNSPVPDPFDLANIVYSANMVVPRLKFFTNQFAYNEIEYLIYCVLHDKDPIWNGPYSADFEFLLNEAPCEGPHYYNSNLNINGNFIPQLKSIYWSKPSRWKNGYELFEHALDDVNNGEYSGLDYMLLFNVYCLLNPSYVSYSFNAANRVVESSQNYPYTYPYPFLVQPPIITAASNLNPKTMAIFETITSSANVNYHNSNLYGDITYKAGKQIHLTSGFKVQKGAKFHALIEPVMCDANGQYRAASNSVVWDNAGNDNPVPMNSKINYTATKKEIKPQKKRPNSLKNSMANFSDLLIYPNPTDGEVQVSLASKETLNEIELIDLVGNKVMTLNVSSNEVTLNLKGLEKGCYLIKCKANLNKVYYKKIVLN